MNNNKKSIITMVFIITSIFCVSAFAANNEGITIKTKAFKEIVSKDKDGFKEIQLLPTEYNAPGDVIQFNNSYKNNSDEHLDKAVITNPISKYMEYIDGSATGEGTNITFSINKGKTFDVPANLFKTVNGKKRIARASEYTDIKWTFTSGLPAGKSGAVSFKAKIK